METIEIELNRIFVKVVQHGSFSAAARALNVQKSTVSKGVSRLEQITGTKLLLRTTRSFSLTKAGQEFYGMCLGPVQILEDAQKSLFGLDSILSGHIRITAPEEIGTFLIAPVIGELSKNYSDLTFDLQFTNQIVDLVKDGFDLAIRLGTPKESQLILRKIGNLELVLVASNSYLHQSARIKSPTDLKNHRCMSISGLPLTKVWPLKNGKRKYNVSIRPIIEGNQMSSLLKATLAGAGIMLAPHFLCKPYIQSGQLVRVLDGWNNSGLPMSLLSPLSISTTPRLKIVGDALIANILNHLKS